MKLVTVEDLREGDIIASDVLLEDYTVVLSKGTVIKTQYIDKLRELEVYTVYIEERQEKEEVKTQPKPPVTAKKTEEKPPATPTPAAKTPAPQTPPQKKTKKLSMEKVTILRDDVEEQVKNKIKDILELHIYQQTEGLQKIAETAQNIITDILEEEEVVEKVYDVRERSADIYEHSLQVCTIATLFALR